MPQIFGIDTEISVRDRRVSGGICRLQTVALIGKGDVFPVIGEGSDNGRSMYQVCATSEGTQVYSVPAALFKQVVVTKEYKNEVKCRSKHHEDRAREVFQVKEQMKARMTVPYRPCAAGEYLGWPTKAVYRIPDPVMHKHLGRNLFPITHERPRRPISVPIFDRPVGTVPHLRNMPPPPALPRECRRGRTEAEHHHWLVFQGSSTAVGKVIPMDPGARLPILGEKIRPGSVFGKGGRQIRPGVGMATI